jgi:hypothetical protein
MFTFGAKAHIGDVLNTATTTTAATIDGVISDVEWDAANSYTLTFIGGATLSVDIYIMKDDNNLYVALRWNDETPWEWDGVLLMFDFDNDGFFEDPDDDASTIDDAFCFQTNLGWWSETYTRYWTWDPVQNSLDEIPGHLGNSSSDWVSISNPGVTCAISWSNDYYTWETSTPLLIFGQYTYLGFGMAINDHSKPSTDQYWFSSWWPTTFPTLNDPEDWDAADASGMGDLDLGLPPVAPEVEVRWEMIYEADNRVTPGDIVMYNVTVTNLGTTTIDDVKVALISKAGTPISVGLEASENDPDKYEHPTTTTDAGITQSYGDLPSEASKSRIFRIWVWLDKNVRPGDHLFLHSVYDVSSDKWTYYYEDVWKILQLTTGSWDLGILTSWVTGSTKNSLTVDVKEPDFSDFYPDTNENGHPDVIVRIGEKDGVPLYGYVAGLDQELTSGSEDGPDYTECYQRILFGLIQSTSDTYHIQDPTITNLATKTLTNYTSRLKSVVVEGKTWFYYTYGPVADTPEDASKNVYFFVKEFFPWRHVVDRYKDLHIIKRARKGEGGDCIVGADLTISFFRSMNIPARFIAADTIYSVLGGLYHAWVEVLLPPLPEPGIIPPRWVQVDPAAGIYNDPGAYNRKGWPRFLNVRYFTVRDCLYVPANLINLDLFGHGDHWDNAEDAPNDYIPPLTTPKHVIHTSTGAISQGETLTIHFTVPELSRSTLTATLSWAGSDLDLHLYDPLDRHVGFDYSLNEMVEEIPNAKYYGCRIEFILVETPIPGVWTVEFYGVNVTDTTPFYLAISLSPPPAPLPTIDLIKIYEQPIIHIGREGAVIAVTNATATTEIDVVELDLTDNLPQGWYIKNEMSVSAVIYDAQGHMFEVSRADMSVSFSEGKLTLFINFTKGVTVTDEDGTEFVIHALKFNETIQVKYPIFPPETLTPIIYKTKMMVEVVSPQGGTMTAVTFTELEVKEKPGKVKT